MTDLRLQQRIGHSDREALEHIARALEGRVLSGGASPAGSAVTVVANGANESGAAAKPGDSSVALSSSGIDTLIEAMPAALGILKGDTLIRVNSAFAYAFGYRSPAELIDAGGLDAILPGGIADLSGEAPNGRITEITALTRSRRRLTVTFLLATLDSAAQLRLLRLVDPSDIEPEAPEPQPEREPVAKASILSLTPVPPVTPVPDPVALAPAETSPADLAAVEAPVAEPPIEAAAVESGTSEVAPSITTAHDEAVEPPASQASEESQPEPRPSDREGAARRLDFLAKVSHEVRTPLNSIIGFADLMLHERFGPVGNARYRGYAEDIHQSGLYALSLLNDLLDISKIEAGKFELDFTAVDAAEVVEACVASLQPLAKRTRIVLRTSFADDLPLVVADPRRLRQIMLNLLTNAIKFTKEGGQVIVSGTVVDGELRLRVHDTGVGMSKNDIAYAMEPFHQLDTSPRHQSGTGLGLPLTKALTDAIRARLELMSEPGVGTTADVIFPKERLACA